MGITFKENCPDTRNTKVVDVIHELIEYETNITVYDPWVNQEDVKKIYDLDVVTQLPESKFDVIVLAVAHKEFEKINFTSLLNSVGLFYSIK